jgi:WD40 repeat protein
VLHTFRSHTAEITALAFSTDGKQLASGSYDGSVLVWDLSAIGK